MPQCLRGLDNAGNLSIIALGTWLFQKGLITVGEIATFMALAGMVISRLEQAVIFANRMTLDAARLREFFDVLDSWTCAIVGK